MNKIKSSKNDKFVWGGFHPFSYHPIVFHLIPDLKGKLILDCGCGKGIWGYLMRTVRSLEGSKLIGIDLDEKYLKFCRRHRIYDVYRKATITKLPVKNSSVDFLICSEVIEHLSRKEGVAFLDEVERVMEQRGRVIITTPNMVIDTYLKEGKDSHSSCWNIDDFNKRGYKVYGMGIRINPSIGKWYTPLILSFGHSISPISFYLPQIAGYLIAVKDF